ncbi:MAG: hypothetical protein GWN84_10265 [Gammaproteobacteria bacterium]|nr:hypothetical protein [Gammaproteobacteria bacterium]NIR83250.1 hypothetical protein [Gammaproteobacteria bacterium]NIR91054.1 hypothetical protein [Gammaproteobacteria bacterium]NIU04415.1 hypothetical protein [Gammaproteobacteria bacterium]NIV76370.1 hypothetical protein [Gammaproteobacteria bacterium]
MMTEIIPLLVGTWQAFYEWAGEQPIFVQILFAWGAIELAKGLLYAPLAGLRAYASRRQYKVSMKKAASLSKQKPDRAAPSREIIRGERGWIG